MGGVDVIKNLKDLADEMWLNEDIDSLKRCIYKNTNCGAWIEQTENGIKIGSIVEGSDAETETYTLEYPFEIEKFWACIEAIESEAEILWDEANT